MANLTAKFELIDQMSEKLSSIAERGQSMINSWQDSTSAASDAMSSLDGSASSVVTTADGVAQSIDQIRNASGDAASSADSLSDSLNAYGSTVSSVTGDTDDWTDAVGNYSKEALEAVYSTEELVNMGLKSSNALKKQDEMMQLCQKSSTNLSNAMEASTDIMDELNKAMSESEEISRKVCSADELSEEAKEKLAKATSEADQAYKELAAAQEEAQRAMQYYNSVLESGTDDLDELESAAEKAQHAAEGLEEANEKAAKATEDLEDASEDASKELDDLGDNGKKAMQSLSDALAAAGVVAAVKEIAEALLEASQAAEEFETSIAKLQTIAGSESIGALTSDITKLSNETGISANSLADVAYNAISAGSAVEDAVGTAEAAAKLAAAGFTDTTSALSVLSTAMNSYGDAAGTAEEISNSLIMVQNLGVTTVGELSSQVGKAIATASAYNVSLGNLESAYVSTTKSGIATAESTTYISGMMNELGKSSSSVAKIIQAETGQSFGELMNSGYTLADVLGILYDNVNGDAEAMMNLWGSAEAGKAAAAIVNQGLDEFNNNLNKIENSAGATQLAYETMADTTAYAHQQMTNAMDNLQIAIGSGVNPAMEKLYEAGAKAFTAMTDFANEHPVVVKAATAIAVGIGAVTVGVVAFTAATTVLIPAITGLGIAINAALGPIGWIAAGITAVTVAVTAFTLMMDKAEDETLDMTSVTKAQHDELEELEKQYESACDTFGETSNEALALKYDIDELNKSYQDGYQTMEQFAEEMDGVLDSHKKLMDEIENNESALKNNELDNLSLIAKLQQLASQTDQTAGSQDAMKVIIDQLNNSIEGLNLTYEDLTSNQSTSIDMVKQMAEAQAEQERQQEQYNEYVELIKQQAKEQEALAKATDEVTASTERNNQAQAEYSEYIEQLTKYDTTGFAGLGAFFSDQKKQADAASDALEQSTKYQQEMQDALDETNRKIEEVEESWKAVNDAMDTEQTISDAEAISQAYEGIKQSLEELAEKYDEAYEAAKSSFEGQFSLFEEANMKSDDYMKSTVENAQKALETQLAYWNEYSSNIETLKALSASDLGITQENYDLLMSKVQDGSEQAAGLAASMVDAIERGNTDTVTKLADTLGQVDTKQSEIAASTADWVTDYTAQVDAFAETMTTTITEDLELSSEAEASAKSTIESYAEQLKSSGSSAVSAAKSIAEQVSKALASAKTTVSVNTKTTGYAVGTTDSVSDFVAGEKGPELVVPAHANGTLEGEDYYIAGDNGPELIVGEPGSTVFPTSETEKIINAFDKSTSFTTPDISKESNLMSGLNSLLSLFTGISSETSLDARTDEFGSTQIGLEEPSVAYGSADASLDEKPLYVESNEEKKDSSEADRTEKSDAASVSEKHITLEINGSGSIDVGGGADKNSILEVLQEHLKPVLMNIIQSEVYEEGDLSYEF